MLIKEPDIGVSLLKSLVVPLVKAAGGGYKEEDMEEFAQNSILVTIVEECRGSKENREINAH